MERIRKVVKFRNVTLEEQSKMSLSTDVGIEGTVYLPYESALA
jgi:hypothetical protein